MKRKSDQSHVQDREHTDKMNREEFVAFLEARVIEELSVAGYVVRETDDSMDRTAELSPTETACTEHRKRLKRVSSTKSEECEDLRVEISYGLASSAHGTLQPPARPSAEYPSPEHSCTEIQSAAQRRMSTSPGSSLSSPSDSEPVTPVGSSPAQTRMHYRRDSAIDSEVIHFQKFNKDNKSSQAIVNDILEIIKTPAKCSSKRNLYQDGFIYVLHDPSIPGHVKIGRTATCPTRRKKQIATCSKLKVDFVGSQRLIIGAYHERLEQIIHADLYNERRYFECPCSTKRTHNGTPESDIFTKHGEWFEMDADEADHRVEQWRNWMRQEPYKKPGSLGAGELKSDFRRRVQYCYEHPSEEPEERWTKFMAPYYMAERDQLTINGLT